VKKILITFLIVFSVVLAINVGTSKGIKNYVFNHSELSERSKTHLYAASASLNNIVCAIGFGAWLIYLKKIEKEPIVFSFNGKCGKYTIHANENGTNPHLYMTLQKHLLKRVI